MPARGDHAHSGDVADRDRHCGHLGAVGRSTIEGCTFGWYPCGLVAGHALRRNFLPAVADQKGKPSKSKGPPPATPANQPEFVGPRGQQIPQQ